MCTAIRSSEIYSNSFHHLVWGEKLDSKSSGPALSPLLSGGNKYLHGFSAKGTQNRSMKEDGKYDPGKRLIPAGHIPTQHPSEYNIKSFLVCLCTGSSDNEAGQEGPKKTRKKEGNTLTPGLWRPNPGPK